MQRLLCTLLLVGCFGQQQAECRVLGVPGQYSTIQSAILAAVNGDTVLVEPGTYAENINFRGRRIVVASRYLLSEDPAFIKTTIINGGSPTNVDTASCVIIASGEDSTTVLQGFTLTGGTGTKWLDEHGAGVYVEGGAVLTQYSSPVIRDNLMIGNTAIRRPSGTTSAGGGAIRVGDGMPRILNNVIVHNSGMYGGGIVLNYTGAIVRNNIIAHNSVYQAVAGAPTFGGGGIWVYENLGTTPKVIENNTIIDNSVSGTGSSFAGRGGGILVSTTVATVRNNIVWGNSQSVGGQLGILTGGSEVTYSDVEGGWTGVGNIDLDPQFADTSYHLPVGSPCVDAGDTSAVYRDPEDSGNPGNALYPSRGGLRNDMGTYGGPSRKDLGSIVTSAQDPVVLDVPQAYSLAQNFPNPFNPSTRIQFVVPVEDVVTLRVYDVLGREVATLVEGVLEPGAHSVDWEAGIYASGIYTYSLTSAGFHSSRKMLLLR